MAIPLLVLGGVGLAAGAGAAIAGGIGASNAAKAQSDAANRAMDLQRQAHLENLEQQQRFYDQQRDDMAPWLRSGRASLADLMRQMQAGSFNTRLDPNQIANDPGYQFRMAEGQKALERSAAARGGLNSGGMMKSLSRYSQGVASDEYNNAWSRQQADNAGRFNRLASMAGVGQAAAQTLGQLGSQASGQMTAQNANYANTMGQLLGAYGNAQSAGATGVANAIGNGFQTAGNAAMMGGMMHYGGLIPRQGQG